MWHAHYFAQPSPRAQNPHYMYYVCVAAERTQISPTYFYIWSILSFRAHLLMQKEQENIIWNPLLYVRQGLQHPFSYFFYARERNDDGEGGWDARAHCFFLTQAGI
jgi:hypothetical protein